MEFDIPYPMAWHGSKYSQRNKNSIRDQTMIKYFHDYSTGELSSTFMFYSIMEVHKYFKAAGICSSCGEQA